MADLVHLNCSKYSFVADPKATVPGDSSKKASAKPCSVAWSTAPLPKLLPFLSWPCKFPQYPSTAWVPAVRRKLEEAGLFRSWSWKTSRSFGEATSLGSRDDLVNCFGPPGLLECRTVAKRTAGGRAPTRFASLNPPAPSVQAMGPSKKRSISLPTSSKLSRAGGSPLLTVRSSRGVRSRFPLDRSWKPKK